MWANELRCDRFTGRTGVDFHGAISEIAAVSANSVVHHIMATWVELQRGELVK
jgi:hypothetical protein